MSVLLKELKLKEKELKQMIERSEKDIQNAPQGKLRISKSKGYPSYYWIKGNQEDINYVGTYIKKHDRNLAAMLAQKDYAKTVHKISSIQLNRIEKLLNIYEPDAVERVYSDLNEERKKLVTPYLLPTEDYIAQWETVSYEGKCFSAGDPEIYTENGERVRSKSEKIIADKLKSMGIPYRYECPLILKGMGQVYPDFTVLNVRTCEEFYWEHLGMMDNPEYCEKALGKIEYYEKNGLMPGKQLILSHETKVHPINTKIVEKVIAKYLI